MSPSRWSAGACAGLCLAACTEPGAAPSPPSSALPAEARSADLASASSATVPEPTAAASSAPAASASSAPAASASSAAAAAASSWLGVPVPSPAGPTTALAWDGAELRLAGAWKSMGFGNGMSEGDIGQMAYLPAEKDPKREARGFGDTKLAIVILYTHGAVHDALLDYGGGTVLSMTGDVSSRMDPPRHVEVGSVPVDVLTGEGKLGAYPADVWQIRRKRPTSKDHGSTVLILGAVRKAAPNEARDAFLASLASLVVK